MWCVGDDSSHLLFNEANLNYHHLHTTYTTGVHAMYSKCTNAYFIAVLDAVCVGSPVSYNIIFKKVNKHNFISKKS